MPLFRPGWTAGVLRQSSGCFNTLVALGTWIQGFLLFIEWHQDGIATNGRRPWRPFRAVPNPDYYRMQSYATKKQCSNKPYVRI